jgi:hypothetical protein
MNGSMGRDGLIWAIPTLALILLLAFETDWGRAVHRLPPPLPAVAAKPVSLSLLPEYQIEGGLAGHPETVGRTLFNPTRRPAPAQVVDQQAKQRLQRGQFVLTGTAVAGDRNVAFLREVAGGRSRLVRQGDQINGLVVADVRADRVKLVLGDEAEEIVLKAVNAPGPVRPGAPPAPGQPPQPGQPVPAVVPPSFGPAPPAQVQPPPGNAIEQRRAARAAAAAAPAVNPPPVQTPTLPAPAQTPAATTPGTGMPANVDPAWNEVFRRMQTRQQP